MQPHCQNMKFLPFCPLKLITLPHLWRLLLLLLTWQLLTFSFFLVVFLLIFALNSKAASASAIFDSKPCAPVGRLHLLLSSSSVVDYTETRTVVVVEAKKTCKWFCTFLKWWCPQDRVAHALALSDSLKIAACVTCKCKCSWDTMIALLVVCLSLNSTKFCLKWEENKTKQEKTQLSAVDDSSLKLRIENVCYLLKSSVFVNFLALHFYVVNRLIYCLLFQVMQVHRKQEIFKVMFVKNLKFLFSTQHFLNPLNLLSLLSTDQITF